MLYRLPRFGNASFRYEPKLVFFLSSFPIQDG
jgi:hypothetical protein